MKDIHALDWLRELFLGFDDMAKPVMGIGSWDDAVVAGFGGKKLVLSCDGPYKKRLVMKSALVHASTDVVVKGGRILFALDTLGGSDKDIREMANALKNQALAMGIPILGGNTMIEEGEPKANIFVVGELMLPEPIRDSGGRKGDRLAVIGEPIWGEPEERFAKAKQLFGCWYDIVASAEVHASKDVTKGGLVNTALEIAEKSGLKHRLYDDLPYHLYRNLDNFLIAVDNKNLKKIGGICSEKGCPLVEIGELI